MGYDSNRCVGVGVIARGNVSGVGSTTYTLDSSVTNTSMVRPGPHKTQIILDVAEIPCGNHTLTLIRPSFDPNNAGKSQGQISLHAFKITPCPSNTSTTTGASPPSINTPPLGLPPSFTTTTVASSPTTTAFGASTRSAVSPGQIAGIVIGCLLFVLALLGLALFFIRRRRRQKQQARPSAEFLTHVSGDFSFLSPPVIICGGTD